MQRSKEEMYGKLLGWMHKCAQSGEVVLVGVKEVPFAKLSFLRGNGAAFGPQKGTAISHCTFSECVGNSCFHRILVTHVHRKLGTEHFWAERGHFPRFHTTFSMRRVQNASFHSNLVASVQPGWVDLGPSSSKRTIFTVFALRFQ